MSFAYSLYIPRVFKGITQEQIRGTFYGKSIGKVGRVDLLKVYSEKNTWVYNKAFVHFDEWFANDTSIQLKSDIDAGSGGAKLNYDGERFWMLLSHLSDSVPSDEQNNTDEPLHMHQQPMPMHMHMHPMQEQPLHMHPMHMHQQPMPMQEQPLHMHPMQMQPMMYHSPYDHNGQPIIPQYILANPYGYLEPPADIGNRNRYYTNYTAHHHAHFSPQFSQQQPGDQFQAPRIGAPTANTSDPN